MQNLCLISEIGIGMNRYQSVLVIVLFINNQENRLMKFLNTFFAVFFIVITAGCSSVGTNDNADLDESFFESAAEVQFSTVSQNFVTIDQSSTGNYKFEEKENLVINDQESFEVFWKELNANQNPLPEIPDIDFSEFTVIAALMGIKSTGGFTIEISQISRAENVAGVKITEVEPGSNCVVTQVITAPYHVVKTPKIDANIEFVTKRITKECDN